MSETPASIAAPPTGPATLAGVKALLRITTDTDDDLIQAAVDATNMFVWRLPGRYSPTYVDPRIVDGDPDTWEADTAYGATMLAGRLYRRRNSPAGVESFSDLGGAVYVQRNDPDIAMMLGIGAYTRPRVG